MTVVGVAATSESVHTGACVALPRALMEVVKGLRWLVQDPPPREREYCVHDEAGHPLGIVRSPAGRPRVGRDAPAVYLHRSV